MKEDIEKMVISVVKDIGEELGIDALKSPSSKTKLFGKNLDSMGVVLLVAEIEDELSENFNLEIAVADERAMSQKTSPFRTISSLTKYLEVIIDEQNH